VAGADDANGDGTAIDPGFGSSGDSGAGDDSLPSMTDDSPQAGGAGRIAQSSDAQRSQGDGASAGGVPQTTGDTAGSGSVAGTSSMPPGSERGNKSGGEGTGDGIPGGSRSGSIPGAFPAGMPGGQGTLTRAEQVAILDAELERGAGEFDSMILEEQTAARESAREQGDSRSRQDAGSSGGGEESAEEQGSYGGGMASSGGYGAGGGMGGGSRRDQIPENTAKYPAPDDIPDGKNDDVVARQLREAAMREPDPAVRERLWAEYRKYKGIDQP